MKTRVLFAISAMLAVAGGVIGLKVKPVQAATTAARNLTVAELPLVGMAAVDEVSGTISICGAWHESCSMIGKAAPGTQPSLAIVVTTSLVPTTGSSNYFFVVSSLTGDAVECLAYVGGTGQCSDIGVIPH